MSDALLPSDVLIGRDRELDRARLLLGDGASNHSGGALIVIGPAGIGKSALLAQLAFEARESGRRVLGTTGVESESEMPYSGLHELIAPLLSDIDDGRLPRVQADALATAFGLRTGPRPEPFLVALGVLHLLEDLGDALVVADDAHWLDAASQDALAFVARRTHASRVALLAGIRVGHDTPLTHAHLDTLELGELDPESSAALLARHVGMLARGSTSRILAAAHGNPLALVELPAGWPTAGAAPDHLVGSVPLTARLERAFGSRLAELPAAARDLLLVAAVDDGDEVGEILAAAGRLGDGMVGPTAVDIVTASRLAAVVQGRIRFRHPLVRSGIVQAETDARRRAAHEALADCLTVQPYRRSWHRALAVIGPDEQVADELEGAHETALGRGSVAVAIRVLERSAELTADPAKRVRRLLLAAEHAFGLGRADLVEQYVATAEQSDLDTLDQARIRWLREIFNDGAPGDAARVLELCDSARLAFAGGDRELGENLLLGAALRCWWADSGRTAQARVVEIAEAAQAASDEPLTARHVAILGVAEPMRRAAAVIGLLERMPAESVQRAEDLHLLGMAAHAVGDCPRAIDYLQRAETRLREEGRIGLLAQAIVMQIPDLNHVGDWPRALAAISSAQQLAQVTGQPIWDTGASVLAATVYGLHGEAARAADIAAEAELSARGRRLNNLLACAQLARGFGFAASGHYTEAFEALLPLFDPAAPCRTETERFHGIGVFIESAVHTDRVIEARRVLAELEEVGRVTPSPALHNELRYARALLAEPAEQEDTFRAALAADLTRWPWCEARLQLAYGTWLRRQRRPAESRALLRSAASTCEAIGATAWRNQARSELRAAGEASEQASALASALTAQELQIARLAAAGMSNREIGERLYLSPRTVGSHLYRIFPKVGITSRSQLAEWLRALPGGAQGAELTPSG